MVTHIRFLPETDSHNVYGHQPTGEKHDLCENGRKSSQEVPVGIVFRKLQVAFCMADVVTSVRQVSPFLYGPARCRGYELWGNIGFISTAVGLVMPARQTFKHDGQPTVEGLLREI